MTHSQSSPSFENIPNLEGISKELLCQLPDNSDIWHNLKQAIATSSGFKRWQLERSVDGKFNSLSLDTLVRSYLRETLETLAY
jgi:hypothetical protein